MQKDYTYFGGAPDNVVNAIKAKLNPSLGMLVPALTSNSALTLS